MKKTSLKDYLLEIIPENLHSKLPTSFEIVGDIAIIEIPEELKEFQNKIGEALLKVNKALKVILTKSGIHHGEFRTQDLVHIAGEDRKETLYLENGIRLKINPETVYFSARLSTERAELMKNLEEDKRVLVMFSGAGPYTYVGLKKQPNLASITSIEINPEGHKYALESLELNKNILKKSDLFKSLVGFFKGNNLPIIEKQLLSNLNKLKLNFINGDVEKVVDTLVLKPSSRTIKEFEHSSLFTTKNTPKWIVQKLKEETNSELLIDLDNMKEKEECVPYLIAFASKFSFVFKKEGTIYECKSFLEKNYFLNYLQLNMPIETSYLYDEIFMPLPKDAQLFLDSAFKVADKNSVVHMYDFLHDNEFPQSSENAVEEAAKRNGREVEILQTRKVGQYSPRKYRVCCDFKILN